jgi:hypothetical protein
MTATWKINEGMAGSEYLSLNRAKEKRTIAAAGGLAREFLDLSVFCRIFSDRRLLEQQTWGHGTSQSGRRSCGLWGLSQLWWGVAVTICFPRSCKFSDMNFLKHRARFHDFSPQSR